MGCAYRRPATSTSQTSAGRGYQQTLRILGKGDKPAEVVLNPRTQQAVDQAATDRAAGPLFRNKWRHRMHPTTPPRCCVDSRPPRASPSCSSLAKPLRWHMALTQLLWEARGALARHALLSDLVTADLDNCGYHRTRRRHGWTALMAPLSRISPAAAHRWR
jgi:hypothetical protein